MRSRQNETLRIGLSLRIGARFAGRDKMCARFFPSRTTRSSTAPSSARHSGELSSLMFRDTSAHRPGATMRAVYAVSAPLPASIDA